MDSSKETKGVFDKTLIDAQAQYLLAQISDYLKSKKVRAYLVVDLCVMSCWAEIPTILILPWMLIS